MPYSVGKHSSCPDSKPHAVVKDDGSVVPGGCHETRQKALKHQRALMANVPDAKAEEIAFLDRLIADGEPAEDPRSALESVAKLAK